VKQAHEQKLRSNQIKDLVATYRKKTFMILACLGNVYALFTLAVIVAKKTGVEYPITDNKLLLPATMHVAIDHLRSIEPALFNKLMEYVEFELPSFPCEHEAGAGI